MKKPIIVVYQMGKVGSSSVVKSLRAIESCGPVYQIHHLTDEGIERAEKLTGIPHLKNRFLRRKIQEGAKLKVVTLVRGPIARNVSVFFENMHRMDLGFSFEEALDPKRTEDLIKHFFSRDHHEVPLRWFDDELRPVLGIDVFASKFPVDKGYKIYKSANIEMLLLKLETLKKAAPDAFREFLGIEDFKLVNANIGEEKKYSAAYKKFIKSITFSQEYLDRMYTSRYTRHFYSDEEIKVLRAKWDASMKSAAVGRS